MNRVQLIGHVGRNPETSFFENGKKVTKFSLATTESFGKDNKETNWHSISIWGDYGETMGKFIKTGSQILAEGRIQYGEYEKDGVKIRTTTIVTEKIELLDKKTDSSENSSEPNSMNTPEKKSVSSNKVSVPPAQVEDDLPF